MCCDGSARKSTARGGRTVLDSPIGDIPNTCAPPDDVPLNCPDAPEDTMVCTYGLTPAAAKKSITWRRDASPISEN
jgi:hypothetical protein